MRQVNLSASFSKRFRRSYRRRDMATPPKGISPVLEFSVQGSPSTMLSNRAPCKWSMKFPWPG